MTPLVLVGEARGEVEDRADSSFVGPSGAELLRMLAESGILDFSAIDREYLHRYYQTKSPVHLEAIWTLHPELFRTNVFQIHPPKNDLAFFCGAKAEALPGYPPLLKSKYVRREYEPELDRLAEEIATRNPNIIVCLGNSALWALAGRTGITKYRGTTLLSTHTVLDFKLIPVFHPAAILRQWENRPIAIADLIKAHRESAFPEIRRPHREIWIEPTLGDIREFVRQHIPAGTLLSVDIETSGSHITCIGFAPTSHLAIVIPFDDARRKGGSYWPTRADEVECWNIIAGVLRDRRIRKLFQNGAYDIAFIWRSMAIPVYGAEEDTMLLHHALHPESLKSLGFLGSVYSDEGAWKHMRKMDTIKRDD